jgi:hypothetical protein
MRWLLMWIRFYREKGDKEILVNSGMIWKIEVTYLIPGPNRMGHPVGLERGLNDPEAIRAYKIFFGSETANVAADSTSLVAKVIQGIYDNCQRG